MKHSLEEVVRVLRERVGGQWEGSEIDGRDAIMDVMHKGLGYSRDESHEMFDALLNSGELRYRRLEHGDMPADQDADISAEQSESIAPAVLPGAVSGIGLSGPGVGGNPVFPAAVGAGLGGGFWQIGRSQDDEMPPMAGRAGQVDPTA